MPKRLNAGCGTDIRDGWLNLDRSELPGVDVTHDLDNLPLPFDDDAFEEILAQDILEHVRDLPGIMSEFQRLLKPGGTLRVRAPHFTSENLPADPTHVRGFSARSFEFFLEDNPVRQAHVAPRPFSRMRRCRITFARGILFFNPIVEGMFNLSRRTQKLYESTGLRNLFPAENVECVLEK